MTTESNLELRVQRSAEDSAAAAAALVAEDARAVLATRPVFTLALSGGRTPARMLEVLAREDIPWERVHVFQVDERVAPAGDPARNLNMVHTALGAHPALPAGNVHPMPVEDDDLHAAARRYSSTLTAVAGPGAVLDLIHLGLGDDGHTASLVPGDAALAVEHEDVCLTGEYRGHLRMTLTYPTINRARRRLWLATGSDKGEMLARLHAGDTRIPAGRVSSHRAVICCDADAARAAELSV